MPGPRLLLAALSHHHHQLENCKDMLGTLPGLSKNIITHVTPLFSPHSLSPSGSCTNEGLHRIIELLEGILKG